MRNYEDFIIYFTRYVHIGLIKTLRLHYHELMGKIKKHKGKKYLMLDDYMLNKKLNRIKEIIGIEEFDNIKILAETNDKLPDNIILQNAMILITFVLKDGGKFYPQLFLEDKLFFK